MELVELEKQIQTIEADAGRSLSGLNSLEEWRNVRAQILSKKGTLGSLMGLVKQFPPADRGRVGQLLNGAQERMTALFAEHEQRIKAAESAAEAGQAEAYDPTLPGVRGHLGSMHPVTQVQWEVEAVFSRLGFSVEAGPELETEYYNFEALNIPGDHPARDMQDTFWLTNGMLLRTHTSPVQVHAMEKFGAPLRVIAPGRCFRYETIDASHENTFHQLEGLMIDRNISIAHLIGVMRLLLREVFGREVAVRLRPGYFPFVEPGFELDMSCLICGGSGCPTCKRSGWVEILPCGMVHPNVLRFGKIDPEQYTGFAFGLGLTRLAMMKFGIADIRVLNQGDLRALVHPWKLSGAVISSNHEAR